jgi:hypothetical protein
MWDFKRTMWYRAHDNGDRSRKTCEGTTEGEVSQENSTFADNRFNTTIPEHGGITLSLAVCIMCTYILCQTVRSGLEIHT